MCVHHWTPGPAHRYPLARQTERAQVTTRSSLTACCSAQGPYTISVARSYHCLNHHLKKRAKSGFHLWAIDANPWPNNRQKTDRNQAMCFKVLSKRTFKQESTLEWFSQIRSGDFCAPKEATEGRAGEPQRCLLDTQHITSYIQKQRKWDWSCCLNRGKYPHYLAKDCSTGTGCLTKQGTSITRTKTYKIKENRSLIWMKLLYIKVLFFCF